MSKKAILLTILLLNLPNTVFADIYKWTDEKGDTHFTNDKRDIPQEYQNKIETPLTKSEIINVEDGSIKVEEGQNKFGFTYKTKDGKAHGCYELWKGKKPESESTNNPITASDCRDWYNKIIKKVPLYNSTNTFPKNTQKTKP